MQFEIPQSSGWPANWQLPCLPRKGCDGIALGILAHDFDQLAQLAFANHLAGKLDHRITGVIVSESKDLFRLVDDLAQLTSLLKIESNGFVADHVESGFQKVLATSKCR